MKTIFITGSSGFVGRNIIEQLKKNYDFQEYSRMMPIEINQEIVLHLAGKAHDLKGVSDADEYYKVNTELTKNVFDKFIDSSSKVFITLSSVKAVADFVEDSLSEDCLPNPVTHYGKSKLLAEQYILSKLIPCNKRVYILRPCMIHGPGNKGNLNLLYKFVTKGIPWPLGSYENKRSFCSIDNLIFIINELIEREDIPSGIYNVSDDGTLSTNEIISLIGESIKKKPLLIKLPKWIIIKIAQMGNSLNLPFNTERLEKLTQNFVVSNQKISLALNKKLPISSRNGMIKTLKSFNQKI